MKTASTMMANGFEVSLHRYQQPVLHCTQSCGRTVSGKRHGKGEYLYNDNSKYSGQWDNDIIKGEGTSWYPNGNK
jgi:hypothetical protein